MNDRRRLLQLLARFTALAVAATIAWLGLTIAPASAYPGKPPTAWSFYMKTTSTTVAYNLGCNQGNADRTNGNVDSWVVLDYGAQNSALTGAYYPATSTFIANASIQATAQEFAHGYWVCTGSDTASTLHLSIGTNNSGSTVTYAAGQAWANLVNAVSSTVSANWGQVIVHGANDIEPWGSYANVLNWANGYSANTGATYLNFGSADGCSQTSYANNGCNNGWNTYDEWNISWGLARAVVSPEIYYNSQASQWWRISQYGYYNQGGAEIHFSGVWDEYTLNTGTYTSQAAWDSLLGKIYSDTNTAYAPYYSQQIHNEPTS